MSDSITLEQQPTIQFTSASVVPGTDLVNAITQLSSEASFDLAPYISNLATQDGQNGDYLGDLLSADKREQGVTALSAGTGGLLGLLGLYAPEQNLIKDVLQSVAVDSSFATLDSALDSIANSSTGLTVFAQHVASTNTIFQASISQQSLAIQAGIPPVSANLSAAFVKDLQQREAANHVLKLILISRNSLLLGLKNTSDIAHASLLPSSFWLGVDVLGNLAVDWTGVGTLAGVAINEGINAVEAETSAYAALHR